MRKFVFVRVSIFFESLETKMKSSRKQRSKKRWRKQVRSEMLAACWQLIIQQTARYERFVGGTVGKLAPGSLIDASSHATACFYRCHAHN